MATTIAKITFLSLPIDGDTLVLNAHSIAIPLTPFARGETFKTIRAFNGQSTIGATIDEAAQNYASAFDLDYNGFNVELLNNVVTITVEGLNFDYFIDYTISNPFATVEILEPSVLTSITVTGLESDRYLINNEINIDILANQQTSYFKTILTNLSNQQISTALITYVGNSNIAQLSLQSIIKSLFNYPADADGYIISDQIVPNANKYKIQIYYNPADINGNPTVEILGFETVKTFIRGGKRTTFTNQTINAGIITPTTKLPVWIGYETAEYYIDNQNLILKRLLADVSIANIEERRTKGCNEVYVKFLNQNGGYSNWLFESHSNIENNNNQGGFIRNNLVDDLGNETDFKLQLESKVPKAFKQLILDLIISPEIYALIEGLYIRVRSGRNSMEYDNIKRSYATKINLEVDNRFNPSLLWSN